MVKQAYLDTTILVSWLKVKDPSIAAEVTAGRIKLPKAAQKCKDLLEFVIDDRLKCGLQTSDWALSEMVQYFRDRAIQKQFVLDGHELSYFNRHKHEYPVDVDDRGVIHDAIRDFEKYLQALEVEIIEVKIDRRNIHDYCLRYSLETPDALHVTAAQNSNYLITTDQKLTRAEVKEVSIIDPGTLITINSQL